MTAALFEKESKRSRLEKVKKLSPSNGPVSGKSICERDEKPHQIVVIAEKR